jgi:O-methyltransferase
MLTNAVNWFRDEVISSRREDWEKFKRQHPVAFKSLLYGYSAYKSYKLLEYRKIYSMFRPYTMLHRKEYINNLALCDEYRNVKGSVVECGTWKGGMIAGIARLLGNDRDYYLYDSFQGLPPAGDEDAWPDGYPAKSWQADLQRPECAHIAEQKSLKVDASFAQGAMKKSGATKVKIVPGWFRDTLPSYDGGPIAILRVDGDFYESIMDTLKNLYWKVAKGGLIILDDYYYWEGASKAVHDFLSANKLADTIKQHHDIYAYLVRK